MELLNPFPALLDYRIFAPVLLRVAAGAVFIYLAYVHYQHREQVSSMNFPVIGRASWVGWFAVIVEAVIGIALAFGYYTQIASIVGVIAALKHVIWRNKYPSFFVLPRTTSLLLIAILLSLLVTGAGLFAFDIPGL
jgi:uncharacterized membrane protein YphA (DoxX/SURF4 family)